MSLGDFPAVAVRNMTKRQQDHLDSHSCQRLLDSKLRLWTKTKQEGTALTAIAELYCTEWHQSEYGCTWRWAGLPVLQVRAGGRGLSQHRPECLSDASPHLDFLFVVHSDSCTCTFQHVCTAVCGRWTCDRWGQSWSVTTWAFLLNKSDPQSWWMTFYL